ncbi:MAG: PH domain-containing protein [Candidatus Micrarchaeales archaeon]
MENKPRISKWIGRGYLLLTIAIIIIYSVIMLSIPFNQILAVIILSVVMVAAIFILCATTYSLYSTTYSIKDGRLYSWSPFAIVNISLKDIAKAEQTRIPFYFRGFGASAYCGKFYIPAVGWTRVIITNMTDGVLIKTKNGRNYLITPSNPKSFTKLLK